MRFTTSGSSTPLWQTLRSADRHRRGRGLSARARPNKVDAVTRAIQPRRKLGQLDRRRALRAFTGDREARANVSGIHIAAVPTQMPENITCRARRSD